jgi:CoA-transferase family III
MGYHCGIVQDEGQWHGQDTHELSSVSCFLRGITDIFCLLNISHRRGILSILDLLDDHPPTRADVSEALMTWDAIDFETEAASKGMCATALRSFDEWDRHPQARALEGTPPVTLVKIGDAPKRQITRTPTRPLDGIRVLDLSRVLAGPVGGRALAGTFSSLCEDVCQQGMFFCYLAHGADVLLVTSPELPALPLLDTETSLGKRTTQLDLTLPSGRKQLTELAKDTDVFLQTYRPRGLEEKGFGALDLATLRPGIVCANLTAWGWDGPWKDRRGVSFLRLRFETGS